MLKLVTPRLELMPFTAPAISALLQGDGPGLARLTGLEFPAPLAPPPLMDALLPLVRDRLTAEPETLGWWTWLAAEREGRVVTGALGFGGPPDSEGSVMLGYATYPGAERHGYASEAARALADWALAQPGVERVCASIPPDNTAARRVAERIGMRIAGTVWEEEIDDILLYELRR